jgi:hypothetical protein
MAAQNPKKRPDPKKSKKVHRASFTRDRILKVRGGQTRSFEKKNKQKIETSIT